MTPIAKGAVGQVYRLQSPKIAGLNQALAYKEILPGLPAQARDEAVHSMEATVAMRDAMDPADRAELDRITTWPLAVVEEQGRTVGTLMPLIPSEFFVTVTIGGNPPEKEVFAYGYLSSAQDAISKMGIDRSLADDPLVRMSLAAQLAYVIGLLHKHGIVYGDISLQNVAIALDGHPRLLVLDCDAAAHVNDQKRHQYHSPAFSPPENLSGAQQKQDLKTDVYKLGLCVLRGLLTGRGVTQLTDPSVLDKVLDQQGVALITRALSKNRDDRPTAKEICLYLEQLVVARAEPPVIHEASLNRQAVLRGQEVVVSWKAERAAKLSIQGLNGFSVPVKDPGAHPNGYAITPISSGPIFVEVGNRYGSPVPVEAGYVDLYELPDFEIGETTLPRPEIPALTPVQIPSIMSNLPAVPYAHSGAGEVPRLDLSGLTELYAEIHDRQAGDQAHRLAETARGTTNALIGAMREASSAASAELHRQILVNRPNLPAQTRRTP
ncbi:MAG TPA: hypothetical protein VL551_27140 [Actinospica sp.]|jgi:hypothetical protein|nr:hypothetical protein [Actinospica sp.]